MATATLPAARTRRIRGAERRSVREVCLLHCDPTGESPRAGDSVRVAGRVYEVVAAEPDGPGYVHVRSGSAI